MPFAPNSLKYKDEVTHLDTSIKVVFRFCELSKRRHDHANVVTMSISEALDAHIS